MPEEQNSAEKDLLKLIENPQNADIQKKAFEAEAAKTAQAAQAAAPAPAAAKSAKNATPKAKFSFSLKHLKQRKNILRGLGLLTVCGFFYLIFSIFNEYGKLQKAKNLDKFTYIVNGREQKISQPEATAKDAEPKVAAPAADTPFRNIFKPAAQKNVETKQDTAQNSLQDYKLVGISIDPGQEESYAMIENVKTKTTFFLKKGESLEGMELVSIREDKLLVKTQGQIVELR